AVFTEDTGNYAVSLDDARRIAVRNGPAGMVRGQAEKLIAEFCKDKWLARSQDGWVVLGTRAIIELQPYFADGFSDYQRHCALCSEMATQGFVCTECYAAVHPYCAEQIASSSSLAGRSGSADSGSGQLSCPKCRRQISRPMRFGPGKTGVPHSFEQTQAEPDMVSPDEESVSRGKKRMLDDSDHDDNEAEEDIVSD
ncbi:Non-structural maintenance of chromosomes element 1, partial [Coemansia sp. RSA 2598]